MAEALFFVLGGEAIRLVSRPAQNHERFIPEDLTAASTHARGHADPQAIAEDAEQLHPCPAALAGYLGRSPDTASAQVLREHECEGLHHEVVAGRPQVDVVIVPTLGSFERCESIAPGAQAPFNTWLHLRPVLAQPHASELAG
jgi:hypothetical protein